MSNFFKKFILQKIFENLFIGFFFFRRNSKTFLIFNVFLLFFIFDLSKADTNFPNKKNNQIEIEYLESRNELEDYIIDTGDSIYLEFYPAEELSGIFPVNEEGELLLPRLDETFVRGLTTSELKNLLEKRYSEFLQEFEIKIRIQKFKPIRVLVRGEVRTPGRYEFPAYTSGDSSISSIETTSIDSSKEEYDPDSVFFVKEFPGPDAIERNIKEQNKLSQIEAELNLNTQSFENLSVKSSKDNIITISKVYIRKVNGGI